MTSRGAKLRAKRARQAWRSATGRPKIEGEIREPNGRISRSGIAHEPADVVALDARVRHSGVSKEQARDQKAATFIGYLSIIGARNPIDGISEKQYDALTKYLDLRASYLRAIKAPDSTLASIPGMGTEEITEAYESWCRTTIKRYHDCRNAIQAEQNSSRANLWAALDICVIRNERHFHMVPDVRVVGNALVHFFRLDG